MSLNKVMLIGNLGADPELRYTPSQMAVCTLRIATTERRKQADGQWADHTEWHRVIVWGKQAENCNQYLKKGRQVYLEGRLQTRKWQDQEGKDRYTTEVVAENVQFLGGARAEGNGMTPERTYTSNDNASSQNNMSKAPAAEMESISFDDDDIPF